MFQLAWNDIACKQAQAHSFPNRMHLVARDLHTITHLDVVHDGASRLVVIWPVPFKFGRAQITEDLIRSDLGVVDAHLRQARYEEYKLAHSTRENMVGLGAKGVVLNKAAAA